MARPLRVDLPDGVYHVTSRGLERRRIVRDDTDRQRWVDGLGTVAQRRDWRVFAWVLMDNHFHLFLRVPHGDLSAGMHDLNSGYVTFFNRRHRRHGPLLQGRFKGILVERDYHYDELSRYVHLNPVRARLVPDPEDYRWGSCGDYFRGRDAPPWLAWQEVLAAYGRSMRAARGAYRAFLREGLASRLRSPLADAHASTLLGSGRFVERMKRLLDRRLPDRDVPAARRLRPRVSIGAVEEAVCHAYAVSAADLRVRGRHNNETRRVAVYVARTVAATPAREVGDRWGGVGPAAVSNIVRRVTDRRQRDKGFAARIAAIERALGQK